MMDAEGRVRIGIVGAGGFARFVAEVVRDVAGLACTGVTDADPTRAADASGALGVPVRTVEELVQYADAVLVATPPSSHAELTLAALAAGRHVFCEKPLALTERDATAVVEAATASGRIVVVDHVIRYNPLVRLLARLRRAGVLGEVQRFAFENDAGDSGLGPDHWFWDPAVSGGILIEHAVHFFDAAGLVIGRPAEAVATLGASRPDGRVDTVVATVRHQGGALATHAHGFSHPSHAERQLMRVDFGLAEARLHGWIPQRLDLVAWTDAAGLAALRAVAEDPAALALPGYRPLPTQRAHLTVTEAPASTVTRDRTWQAPHRVTLRLELGCDEDKQAVYGESVRAALTDFVDAIRTGGVPSAGARHGADAVAVAAAATRALASGRTEPIVMGQRPVSG